jgi:anti-sigma factor ChrR (cupin superfamily)
MKFTPENLIEETTMMKFAWVIEHEDSEPGKPQYFTGARHSAMRWSAPGSHGDAVRFARKQDAERIANFAGFYAPNPTHRICEHGWEESDA